MQKLYKRAIAVLAILLLAAVIWFGSWGLLIYFGMDTYSSGSNSFELLPTEEAFETFRDGTSTFEVIPTATPGN